MCDLYDKMNLSNVMSSSGQTEKIVACHYFILRASGWFVAFNRLRVANLKREAFGII